MRDHRLLLTLIIGAAMVGCSDDTTQNTADAGSDKSPDGPLVEAGLPPLELTKNLCSDPSKMTVLLDAHETSSLSSAFGGASEKLIQQMVAAPTKGPFYMFNLIRYRAKAVYPDGRETNLTGREANALYAPMEYLSAIGAKVVFSSDVGAGDQIDGKDITWEDVAIVEYPCPLAFFAMVSHPGFQDRAVHKEAGVEKTIAMVTELAPSQLPPGYAPPRSPYPATANDPAFELIHVQDFHSIAQYEAGANEPRRTGEEAWKLYSAAGSTASVKIGSYPTALFKVQGVMTGDSKRSWDQIQIVHMPSKAGFQALLADPTRQAGAYHRKAALANNYSLITYPSVQDIPGAPSSGGGIQPPPVASDGTGTPCTDDAACSKLKANKCLKASAMGGFCTVEGCSKGSCADKYVCCHDCNPALAPMLPFKDSACFPAGQTKQLTDQAGCTCD